MLSSVAVLSDIHGVLPALDAVLAEPDVIAADRIVLTGDIAAGPQPVETLDRLTALGDRVVWVRGNADRELAAAARGATLSIPIDGWCAQQLRDDQVELLAGLPHPVTLDVEGFGPVLFCHGSPRDDDEVVLVDTRIDRWLEVLADVPEDVRTIVCGHTHMPFQRLVDRRLVLNPGSVGMPYGGAGAHWALLRGGEARLRRTTFDLAQACAQIVASSGLPDVAEWVDEYVWSRNSDVDAVRAFGPRDGR
ncbi:metallophosphoesterase family protein [Luteipulveratus mongoliensis]|uniref:Phosphoesterase n=1 Tax=Luteipulveratus mongoliensis TaxID=571913 RepID=A0A0K1JLY2_9MICO|nr:metallophosphoesterase family protein [Luteipulveratus mongoliensis]AKU17603.1 phosphoesterase [Luteipulveratus mongoliensis]